MTKKYGSRRRPVFKFWIILVSIVTVATLMIISGQLLSEESIGMEEKGVWYQIDAETFSGKLFPKGMIVLVSSENEAHFPHGVDDKSFSEDSVKDGIINFEGNKRFAFKGKVWVKEKEDYNSILKDADPPSIKFEQEMGGYPYEYYVK